MADKIEFIKKSIFKKTSRLEHFLIKEIKEQPYIIENVLNSRYINGNLQFDELNLTKEQIKKLEKICIVAHGSSHNAGLISKYLMETLTTIHVDVQYSSDFYSFDSDNSLLIAISQSGETTDTLTAVHESLKENVKTIGITNVRNSTLALNLSGNIIDIRAEKENAISATKSYTLTLLNIILLTIYMGLIRETLNNNEVTQYANYLYKLPELCLEIIENQDSIFELSHNIDKYEHFLYLGRGRVDYPTALEGALKLKEIAYIHGEALNDATLKHGPIAMIDEKFVTISLATNQDTYRKVAENIKTINDNKAFTIAIVNQGDTRLQEFTKYRINVPLVPELLSPIINVIPLQLLAYYMGYQKGLPVDRPRNLVKAVLENDLG